MREMPVKKSALALFLFFAGVVSQLSAQPYREYALKLPVLYSGEPVFLAFWVDSTSISVTSATEGRLALSVRYNPKNGEAIFEYQEGVSSRFEEVEIRFKALPMPFAPVNRPKGYVFTGESGKAKPVSTAGGVYMPVDLFEDNRIRRNGSLTRGIIAGTNRDFAIESGLRFELSGQLADSVFLFATLTDQSTPIQPDGSTQNIREFDQVLIKVTSPDFQVQMGDVDISFQTGEFARLRRRLQGFQGRIGTNIRALESGIAVPRGKFRTQQFNGIDGLQGPYRLSGSAGENFIVVLAGSEKVYLDGQLLARGEENDYVIDYGLGEIRFTARRVITDFSRITIDFQYQDSEYGRTLLAGRGSARWGSKNRWFSEATVLREADNDNLDVLSFSDADIEALRNAGNAAAVTVSGVRPATLTELENAVVYERRDTLINAETVVFYRSASSRDLPLYAIRFGKTENGTGAYRRVGQSLNGITYEFVGKGAGEYDTLRIIRPPSVTELTSVRTGYDGEQVHFSAEIAGSRFQGNRLSRQAGHSNDLAYVASGGWKSKPGKAGIFSFEGRQRFTGSKVVFLDRTLDIEFTRKWDVTAAALQNAAAERIVELESAWEMPAQGGASFRRGWYHRGNLSADRTEVNAKWTPVKTTNVWYRREGIASRMVADSVSGTWTRHQTGAASTWKLGAWSVVPSVYSEVENRSKILQEQRTEESFRFADVRPGLQFVKGEQFLLGFDVAFRRDFRFQSGEFRRESDARTLQSRFQWKPSVWYQIESSAAFRKRDYSEWFEVNARREDSDGLLLRFTQLARPFSSGIYFQTLYEVNTERKAQLQETYVEIGPELGQFVWNDLNEDGIQQIAEFFPEQTPNEGIFVKQWIPSDILQPVVALSAKARLRIEPQRIKPISQTMLRFLSLESTLDIRENSTTRNLSDIYLFRWSTFQDSLTTLQGRINWRNQLTLFPNSSKGDLRLLTENAAGMNNQTSGVERQSSRSFRAEGRYRPESRITLQTNLALDRSAVTSSAFDSRNFNIETRRVEPGVTWNPGRSFQYSIFGGLASKTDATAAAEGRVYSVRQSASIQSGAALQATASLVFRNSSVNGNASPSGLFELTEGAGLGSAWQWSLQGSYRVNALLRASASYDGRTIQSLPAVHTVRFVVSAIF